MGMAMDMWEQYVGTGDNWEISVPFPQVFCEPEIVLKKKSLFKKTAQLHHCPTLHYSPLIHIAFPLFLKPSLCFSITLRSFLLHANTPGKIPFLKSRNMVLATPEWGMSRVYHKWQTFSTECGGSLRYH